MFLGVKVMSILKNRILKATALGLALAVTHVCVSAELVRAASSSLVAKVASPQGGVKGRLTTRGNNPVTVDGNPAKTGETIFSGQSISTLEAVGATVNLPGLGRVDIAPNTGLTLSFEDGKINVTLVSGCLVLTANKGVAGSVEAGGSTQRTPGEEGGTIDVCTSTPPGGAPVVGQGAASAAGAGAGGAAATGGTAAAATTGGGGLFGLGTTGTVILLGGAAAATTAAVILVPCRRGPNPSPGTPRGRNDECR
jgi:hypothetical protein